MNTVTRTRKVGRPSRMSEDQKDNIVNNYNMGSTQKELAERYGVSISTIRNILKERSDGK